jgi:hypothetical protein
MKRLLQAGVCASQENRRVGRCQNVEWSGLCLVDQRITSLLAPWFLQGYTSLHCVRLASCQQQRG